MTETDAPRLAVVTGLLAEASCPGVAAAGPGRAALACAYQGAAPGGPPRPPPPRLLSTEPESGAGLAPPPHPAQLFFDEVLSERITSSKKIRPVTGWSRTWVSENSAWRIDN